MTPPLSLIGVAIGSGMTSQGIRFVVGWGCCPGERGPTQAWAPGRVAQGGPRPGPAQGQPGPPFWSKNLCFRIGKASPTLARGQSGPDFPGPDPTQGLASLARAQAWSHLICGGSHVEAVAHTFATTERCGDVYL